MGKNSNVNFNDSALTNTNTTYNMGEYNKWRQHRWVLYPQDNGEVFTIVSGKLKIHTKYQRQGYGGSTSGFGGKINIEKIRQKTHTKRRTRTSSLNAPTALRCSCAMDSWCSFLEGCLRCVSLPPVSHHRTGSVRPIFSGLRPPAMNGSGCSKYCCTRGLIPTVSKPSFFCRGKRAVTSAGMAGLCLT